MAKKPSKKATPKKSKTATEKDPILQASIETWTAQEIDDVILDVHASKTSVFAKEDVVGFLKQIKETFKNSRKFSLDTDDLVDEITDSVCDGVCAEDINDMDLSLNGNEISLDSIYLDRQSVKLYVEDALSRHFKS